MLAVMQVETVIVGEFAVNSVVLWAEHSREAWVVDPGADAKAIVQVLARYELQVERYICTHGHIDHISALDDLLASHPAPVWMHALDAKWAFTSINRLPPAYMQAPHQPTHLQSSFQDGEKISGSGLEARMLATPGHSPGSICLYFPAKPVLLSGDTLFAGSVGRTDLPGSSWKQIQASLKQLLRLPDDTAVICGHGPLTSIGQERQSNPYLQELG